jgi:hypothetical protein
MKEIPQFNHKQCQTMMSKGFRVKNPKATASGEMGPFTIDLEIEARKNGSDFVFKWGWQRGSKNYNRTTRIFEEFSALIDVIGQESFGMPSFPDEVKSDLESMGWSILRGFIAARPISIKARTEMAIVFIKEKYEYSDPNIRREVFDSYEETKNRFLVEIAKNRGKQ